MRRSGGSNYKLENIERAGSGLTDDYYSCVAQSALDRSAMRSASNDSPNKQGIFTKNSIHSPYLNEELRSRKN
jgi:hypothetical protein